MALYCNIAQHHRKFVIQQLLYYFIPFSEINNKVEMTDTLNWRCPPRTTHKIALPKKVVIPLNFCTDELACHNQFSHEKNPNPYPSFNMFIFRKANKCVVQSDSRLKCLFSPKFRYKEETGCIPLMNVSIFSYQNARWSLSFKAIITMTSWLQVFLYSVVIF